MGGVHGHSFVVDLHRAELQQQMFWCIDGYTRHWANFWRACEAGKVAIRKH